jgi:hypothetical protein
LTKAVDPAGRSADAAPTLALESDTCHARQVRGGWPPPGTGRYPTFDRVSTDLGLDTERNRPFVRRKDEKEKESA